MHIAIKIENGIKHALAGFYSREEAENLCRVNAQQIPSLEGIEYGIQVYGEDKIEKIEIEKIAREFAVDLEVVGEPERAQPLTPPTISYIARPSDSRCRWWSVRIPADYQITDLGDKNSLKPLGYLKRGEDLELDDGEAIVDSEARHHRKMNGFRAQIGIVDGGDIYWYEPDAETKKAIKAWATPDQWEILKRGSGDIAGCLRFLLAYRMGFRPADE